MSDSDYHQRSRAATNEAGAGGWKTDPVISRSQQTNARRWLLAFVASVIAALVPIMLDTAASASAAGGAEDRVGAFNVAGELLVGPPQHVSAGQHPGPGLDQRQIVAATGVAAETGGRTLFHYTDEAGLKGITESGRLNPSLRSVNPSDALYGNGQYLSDIAPSTKTPAQLSRAFLGQPFQGQRFTHYIELNVDGYEAFHCPRSIEPTRPR